MIDENGIQYRWETVGRNLDERGQRLFAAAEVRAAGHGGLKVVSRITGLARSTINRGEDDLDGEPIEPGRIRRWLILKAILVPSSELTRCVQGMP